MANVNIVIIKSATKKGYPVKFDIHNGSSRYMFHTKVFLPTVECFQPNPLECVKRGTPDYKTFNEVIKKMYLGIESRIRMLQESGLLSTMTAEDIVKYGSENIPQKAQSINGVDNMTISQLIEFEIENGSLSESTRDTYIQTRKYADIYLTGITVETLTVSDIEMFDSMMAKDDRAIGVRSLSLNSRGIHHSNIRASLNRLMKRGIIDSNPYDRYKVRRESKPKDPLSVDEIRYLLNYQVPVNGPRGPRMAVALDVWKLSFYMCGINLRDLYMAKKSQLRDNIFTYSREKTGQTGRCYLFQEARDIIERYKSTDDDEYILRFHAEMPDYLHTFRSYVNHGLACIHKMICNDVHKCNYAEARTSWADIANDLVGIEELEVDLSLGHAPKTVSSRWYATYRWERTYRAQKIVNDYVLRGVGERKSEFVFEYD